MKKNQAPQTLVEQTNATLDALEREIFGSQRPKRWPPKSGVRAGGLQPAYGTPP